MVISHYLDSPLGDFVIMALFLFLIKKRSRKSFITYANQNKLHIK